MEEPTTDWVIARYTEDLEWIQEVISNIPNLKRVFIYNKGEPLPKTTLQAILKHTPAFVTEISLPNYGREGNTYLTHIISLYEDLPDLTIFTQGFIYDKAPKHWWIPFFSKPSVLVQSISPFEFNENAHSTYEGVAVKKSVRTFEEFARDFFHLNIPEMISYCGIFKSTREKLRRYTKLQYERILTETGLGTQLNPIEGFYLERLWYAALCKDI